MTHRFGWYELYTTDVAAAQQFYSAVVGWTTQKWDRGDYQMWVADKPVGGVMLLPEQAKAMGAPPHWLGYVNVKNVADTTAKLQALGGQVFVAPMDLPDGARIAVVADPTGAAFGLHQAPPQHQGEGMPDAQGLGHFSWAELMSSDPEAALDFYAKLLGWVKTDAMDMGAMGTYQMFGPSKEHTLGGMMRLPPGMQRSAWLYYANVESASAAADKAKAHGGQVMNGPMEVPGGGHIFQGVDPQGAWFALYADKP